ncbi:MAG: single-stranded DNA-binding protein [Bacteroidetes bacterium]|nr:single-stranded DNA-binding protein [Bacteroidota bacterium]
MAGVNKVILIGNLGRDPEIQSFDNGLKKATFTLATTESFKNREGTKEQHTEWHRIVLWRGLADIAESYLKKGSQIYLEGRIRTNQWKDKDGNPKSLVEIEGTSMTMLGVKRDTPLSPVTDETLAESQVNEEPANQTDDLPF